MTLSEAEIRQMRADMNAVAFGHLCTIERDAGTADDYGHVTSSWVTYLEDVPCHFWLKREIELVGSNVNAVIGDAGLLLGIDVLITENDRISVVTNQLDEVVAGRHRILSVMQRTSHLEVDLKAENG